MKKANMILGALLAVLLIAGVYFLLGARLKCEATTSDTDSGTVCDVMLVNSSLFSCQYLEILAMEPENMELKDLTGAGTDVKALSRASVSFTIPNSAQKPCTVQIGYYVLGMRRSATIRFD